MNDDTGVRSSSTKRDWTAGAPSDTGDGQRGPIRWGLVLGAVIALALVLLVVQNSENAQIDWLFFDFETHLWIILLLSAVAGAAVWECTKFTVRRRRGRSSSKRDRTA
jgi:uncharacterized integral membrane protein